MRKEAQQKGFTLIEVLVAVVILSIGLLGLAGMQMWAVKNTGNAFYRTQATLAANEMVERIRANPLAAEKNDYSANNAACEDLVPFGCIDKACPPDKLADDDIYHIACGVTGKGDGVGLDDLLPEGRLSVNCSGDCSVKVVWTEINEDGQVEDQQLELVFIP